MKLQKLLLIIAFMVFSTGNIFAQNNDMKARIEYEDAETAYQNGDYEKTITHLTETEKLLGFWTAKAGYLKIIVLDRIIDYDYYGQEWNDNMTELYRQVKEYMKYANKNPDKIDTDKMREIYAIEKRIDASEQLKDWKEMPEFKNGQAAYEKESYEEAISWYRKAVDKGNGYAMVMLVWYYSNGKGVEQNYQEAINWAKKSADKGVVFAMITIGSVYRAGIAGEVSQNYTEAINWFEKAADKGSAYAMNILGLMYHNGDGVAQDYKEAINWYKKAADKGNADAMVNIATKYREGEGVAKNYNEAMDWYKKAADKGSGLAMINIGHLYYKGNGVTQNYQEAMNWYKKAADKGLATAMSNIADMFAMGEGVAKNYNEAINWYEKSINAGNKDGLIMTNTGYCYLQTQNYTKAMEHYKKGYESDDYRIKNIAKEQIAKMYEEGLGVEKDKKKAKEWRNK
jgi:TPR repeat protein